MSVRVSVCLSAKKNFSSKMDQIRKFSEQTSRILEFPKGLKARRVYLETHYGQVGDGVIKWGPFSLRLPSIAVLLVLTYSLVEY